MQGAWILSLASKLKFHRLWSVAKTKEVDLKITLIIGKCPVVEVQKSPWSYLMDTVYPTVNLGIYC